MKLEELKQIVDAIGPEPTLIGTNMRMLLRHIDALIDVADLVKPMTDALKDADDRYMPSTWRKLVEAVAKLEAIDA